jgi:hypothetical protein
VQSPPGIDHGVAALGAGRPGRIGSDRFPDGPRLPAVVERTGVARTQRHQLFPANLLRPLRKPWHSPRLRIVVLFGPRGAVRAGVGLRLRGGNQEEPLQSSQHRIGMTRSTSGFLCPFGIGGSSIRESLLRPSEIGAATWWSARNSVRTLYPSYPYCTVCCGFVKAPAPPSAWNSIRAFCPDWT